MNLEHLVVLERKEMLKKVTDWESGVGVGGEETVRHRSRLEQNPKWPNLYQTTNNNKIITQSGK